MQSPMEEEEEEAERKRKGGEHSRGRQTSVGIAEGVETSSQPG